jgi:hypothetical protein
VCVGEWVRRGLSGTLPLRVGACVYHVAGDCLADQSSLPGRLQGRGLRRRLQWQEPQFSYGGEDGPWPTCCMRCAFPYPKPRATRAFVLATNSKRETSERSAMGGAGREGKKIS